MLFSCVLFPLQRSKIEVLLLSLLGKRWTDVELFHSSWEEVPQNVKDVLHTYQQSLQVCFDGSRVC